MKLSRRHFLQWGSALLAAPGIARAGLAKPVLNVGCASGDVNQDGAVIWTRADKASRLWVDIDTSAKFTSPRRFRGSAGLAGNDFNMHCVLQGLEPGKPWFYRVQAESLERPGLLSDYLHGQFKTAPVSNASVRFCWSGDTAGQGYGIDESRGGMAIYRTMLNHQPDFFVHSGDQIYADNPLQATKALDDGTQWKNIVTPGKSHVAQTTQDFRDNYYYNYLDKHYRQFYAQVPLYQQWDDHDVHNDWYPGEQLNDPKYQVKSTSLLAARSKQALFECNPIRINPADTEQLYRSINYGPSLQLFILDLRSYRGPNSLNRQQHQGPDAAYMGSSQLAWLKQALAASKATWKIICSDMPLGLIVNKWGTPLAENDANGDGPPLGRELEFAELLGFVHTQKISNVHFITADVHYCGSYHYRPERAVFKQFTPFWEFVSGPLHAGTFGPNKLDNTFGPEEVFIGIPRDMKPNRPPSDGYQFFGQMDINARTGALTVSHFNAADQLLWSKTLPAK